MKTAKKDRAAFASGAAAIIERLGGKLIPGESYRWMLATPYGPLSLHVDTEYSSGPGTVFCRFAIPGAARDHVDCNPYSGKWNHHYFAPTTVADALYCVEWQLSNLLGLEMDRWADRVDEHGEARQCIA